MQKNINKIIFVNMMLIALLSSLLWTKAQAAQPLWTIVPAPGSNPTQTILENGAANVLYVVKNQSYKSKRLMMLPIPGITQIRPCELHPKGKAGDSCSLNLAINGSALPKTGIHGGPILCQANIDNSPNPNQCYRPSNDNNLNITRVPNTSAAITLTPSALLFEVNSTGSVTVTNNIGSSGAANNVAASILGNSNIVVQSSTCGTSLAIGASCTITFTANTQEGPTSVSISGDNTNTANVDITVTNQPIISITSPIQQNRIVGVSSTSLFLVLNNDISSLVSANSVTVSNKANCPSLSVDDSNCINIAPGGSCTLELTSSIPYAPCMITISGSNTANTPTTLIAFSYLGGLIFEESGGNGKIVNETNNTSQWTNNSPPANVSGATSLSDGVNNTNAIVADASCLGNTANCAAYGCRNLGGISTPDWYLPAVNELSTIQAALCSNTAIPCHFGGFSSGYYWSSSQFNSVSARSVNFPFGAELLDSKITGRRFRCIRSFP